MSPPAKKPKSGKKSATSSKKKKVAAPAKKGPATKKMAKRPQVTKRKAFNRLAEHRRYGEHRMWLLDQYPVYVQERNTLRTWLDGYIVGACTDRRSHDFIRANFRRTQPPQYKRTDILARIWLS